MGPLKSSLSIQQIGRHRFVLGILLGGFLASSFYVGTVSVTRLGFIALQDNPATMVERLRAQRSNPQFPVIEIEGYEPPPIPTIVGPTSLPTPGWIELFWAGFSATAGQAAMLAVWFYRPRRLFRNDIPLRSRSDRHARGAIATGILWIGVVPALLGRLWFIYGGVFSQMNLWASALGDTVAPDPFVAFLPFGAVAGILVLFVALEPWRGLRLQYRCGWWPTTSVAVTILFGGTLWGVEQWLVGVVQ